MTEKRLGMLIDLSLCIGCNACAVACKQENGVPLTKFNTWVESWDVNTGEQTRRANQPKLCNHCADAPCVKVCPTGASFRTEEGVVLVDEEKCIGCKYCMAACPFQARWVNDDTGEVGKCTFCYHRSSHGLLPACVSTCVTRARYFGDLNDPKSDIAKKVAEVGGEALYADLGLDPAVLYVGLSQVEGMPVTSAIHRGGNVVKPLEG
ncbi:4Fe-4S dicluster domain-containing protein [Gordonibacter massiliensis (ex Traore et al. 2017)]|uniref:4Fe-4S dicluster domain-containing protein n=1 Tax=Gordonibacter massiliensis (ex Traore et al. 2017) TaxID=1841863 RepID=A0A842JEB1_9ACTN|nr:4Fe-4S dicluster domain-containing protein [Gordonibacter massiliensis (ex Traore et al. 2017)]MBC2888215.1 4Fe-4S dicluster domain-containing protein [Gordonibacter massiliensis (ex Traore et al. 2017)]